MKTEPVCLNRNLLAPLGSIPRLAGKWAGVVVQKFKAPFPIIGCVLGTADPSKVVGEGVSEITRGEQPRAGTPVALFQATPRQPISTNDRFVYDVRRDGQRFLINTQVKSGETQPMSVVGIQHVDVDYVDGVRIPLFEQVCRRDLESVRQPTYRVGESGFNFRLATTHQ